MGSERDAAPAPVPGSGARAAGREALGTLAWIGAAAAVIALAYLSLYIVRRYAYPVLLVAGAAIMEWYFAALLVGILALVAGAFLPGSVRSHRAGTPLVRTPSGRLGVIAA